MGNQKITVETEDRKTGQKDSGSLTKDNQQIRQDAARTIKENKEAREGDGFHETVTVIMPIRNEASFIRESLNVVLDQDYPARLMEVIVADGMSTDQTRQIVREMQINHPNLRLIDNPGQIVPTGLNLALQQARGEIIIRVDGHTMIASNYVKECVLALQHSGADNVGGKMTARGETSFGSAIAIATSSPFGVGNARFHYSDREEWVDTVYMGAWRREAFEKFGLFDEEMVRNQDDEYNYRLRERGGKILLSPKIKSCYTVRNTPRALWKQYFQYGFWKVRVLQNHPRQMSLRQFVPPAFVVTLVVLSLLAPVSLAARSMLALTAGAYLAANVCASLLTASQNGWRNFPYLLVAFGALHLSYGSGFLYGLAKFASCWKTQRNSAEAAE